MGLTEEELRRKYEILKHPQTKEDIYLPDSSPKLTIKDMQTEREFIFPDDRQIITIGRDPECYIHVPSEKDLEEILMGKKINPEIAKRVRRVEEKHANILKYFNDFLIHNLSAEYETFLNDERVEELQIIYKNDSKIRLGDYELLAKFCLMRQIKTNITPQ